MSKWVLGSLAQRKDNIGHWDVKTQLKNLSFLSKLKNDKVGFFAVIVLALLLIIFKGSSSEGQISFLSAFLKSYIEETAAYDTTTNTSQNQLADINSVFAYSGTPGKQPKQSIISTIQDNSLVSRGTILTDIIDEFSDRSSDVSIYEVQEGDTISFIASDYGVSVETIINANNLKSADEIGLGMKLKIPPIDGIIYKVKKGDTAESIAKKYSATSESIISFNSLPKTGELEIDSEIIVHGGKIQRQPNTSTASQNTAKRFSNLPSLLDFFNWPAQGFNWGRIHGRNGVDIANSCGSPVYAAANGNITTAAATDPIGRTGKKMNGGYGKFIRIVHANGTETLYAHASSLLVKIGDYVTKGEQIAVMGTTGNSTGCHLHFEVHGAKNPLAKY